MKNNKKDQKTRIDPYTGEPLKPITQVAIIGGCAKKRYFDQKYMGEIWGINGGCGKNAVPGFTRLFNIHRFSLLKKYGYNFESEKHTSIPVYTVNRWPKGYLRNQRYMPIESMAQKMPRGDYHCGSADWLVAYAIYCGVQRIDLHGYNLSLKPGKPISARACLEYWCGYAEGKGITVVSAPDASMFHFYHLVKSKRTYGIDDCPIFEDKTRKGLPYDYRE